MEYLGFWATQNEILLINNKVEDIVNMTPPNSTKQMRAFKVLLNCYREMCSRLSPLLRPLTTHTPYKVNSKWTDVEQKSFDDIKQVVAHDTLLAYPYFNRRSYIHLGASNYQLVSVIGQEGKPISLYTPKLNRPKTRYTVKEK